MAVGNITLSKAQWLGESDPEGWTYPALPEAQLNDTTLIGYRPWTSADFRLSVFSLDNERWTETEFTFPWTIQTALGVCRLTDSLFLLLYEVQWENVSGVVGSWDGETVTWGNPGFITTRPSWVYRASDDRVLLMTDDFQLVSADVSPASVTALGAAPFTTSGHRFYGHGLYSEISSSYKGYPIPGTDRRVAVLDQYANVLTVDCSGAGAPVIESTVSLAAQIVDPEYRELFYTGIEYEHLVMDFAPKPASNQWLVTAGTGFYGWMQTDEWIIKDGRQVGPAHGGSLDIQWVRADGTFLVLSHPDRFSGGG